MKPVWFFQTTKEQKSTSGGDQAQGFSLHIQGLNVLLIKSESLSLDMLSIQYLPGIMAVGYHPVELMPGSSALALYPFSTGRHDRMHADINP